MMRNPVIVDTNVLVGALPTRNGPGPYAAIVRAMIGCELPFALSAALAREYRAVLLREALLARHGHGAAGVDALLEALAQRALAIEPAHETAAQTPRAPERGDQLLWDLLAAAPSLRLVTEDAALRRDRAMRARVIGAGALLAELAGAPPGCIDATTTAAYRRARYRVDTNPAFALSIDTPSPQLAALHDARGVRCAAFITACNPLGRPLPAAQNAQRAQALYEQLRASGLCPIVGAGEDPDGSWLAEPSVLVPGLGLQAACALGRAHTQNAIVWAGSDAVPRLVLLR